MSEETKATEPVDELEAKRAALEAKRAARAATAAETKRRNELVSIDVVAAAEETHGDACATYWLADGRVVIVKAPEPMKLRRYRGMVNAISTKMVAGKDDAGSLLMDEEEKLARASLVYPTAAEFTALVEKYPAVVGALAHMVLALAGGEDEARAGK